MGISYDTIAYGVKNALEKGQHDLVEQLLQRANPEQAKVIRHVKDWWELRKQLPNAEQHKEEINRMVKEGQIVAVITWHDITIRGNTYPVKEKLKQLGFQWNPSCYEWIKCVEWYGKPTVDSINLEELRQITPHIYAL